MADVVMLPLGHQRFVGSQATGVRVVGATQTPGLSVGGRRPDFGRVIRVSVLLALVMGLAACGSGGGDSEDVAASSESTVTTESTTTTSTTTTSTIPPTTTTTISELERLAMIVEMDAAAIKQQRRVASDAWHRGMEAGFAEMAASNYPGMGNTAEECKRTWEQYYGGYPVPADLRIEYVVDEATIEPDPGWAVPAGPLAGQVPDGRIYIYSMTSTATSIEFDAPGVDTSEVHSTVLDDGTVKAFSGCYPLS